MSSTTKNFSFNSGTGLPYTLEGGSWSYVVGDGATTPSIDTSEDSTNDTNGGTGVLSMSTSGKNVISANYWEWTGTWENLGVPSGSTITAVNGNYDWRCSAYTTGSGTYAGPMELRDNGGSLRYTIVSGNSTFSSTTSWATRTGTNQTGLSDASNTTIKIRVNNDTSTGNDKNAIVTLFQDWISITVTYNSAPGQPTLDSPGDTATVSDATPDLLFTATDADSDDITYELQIDTINSFDSGEGGHVSSASYASDDYILATGETAAYGVWFKPDGTKMFAIGSSNGNMLRYSLSPAWDVSTASLDSGQTLSVTSQDSAPRSMAFSSDGTSVYVCGDTNNRIYQYRLGTAWDLTSASYTDGDYVASADTAPRDIHFSSDGLRMFLAGGGSDKIYSYTLGAAWDITSAVYDSVSYDLSASTDYPTGVWMNSTGTKMYVGDDDSSGTNWYIREYTLSTAWDVSTSSYSSNSIEVTTNAPEVSGLYIDADNTYMVVVSTTSYKVVKYTLPTDPLRDRLSASDSGFTRTADSDPFTSGGQVTYTVQTALPEDTYYWRVRGKDPSGSNTWGNWSTTKSFTVEETFTISGTSDQTSGTASVAINGSLDANTGSIAGDGTWTITGITKPSTGAAITVFVSDASSSDYSTAVTTYGGSGAISGMVLDKHVVTIGSNQNTSVDSTDLAQYDYDQNTKILYSCNGSPDTLLIKYANGSSYVDEVLSILPGNTLTLAASETVTTYDLANSGLISNSAGVTYNIAHDFTNGGVFTASTSTVNLSGTTKQTMAGNMVSTSALYNVTITNNSGASATDDERTGFTPSVDFNAAATISNNYTITTANVRVEYESGKTYTFANINWNGQATGSKIYFRNSLTSGTWLLKVTGTQTVSYVNVSRSDASVSGGSYIDAFDGTNYDGGNNTYWTFEITRIRQEINLINGSFTSLSSGNVSVGLSSINPGYSDTVNCYYEVVATNTDSSSKTITLRDWSDTSLIAQVTIPSSTSTPTRFRSTSFSVPTSLTTVYNDISQTTSDTNIMMVAARIVILQQTTNSADHIDKTETQIEIGNYETGKTNLTLAPLDYPKYWYFDSSKWDGGLTYYAEVSYSTSATDKDITIKLQKDTAGNMSFSDVVTIVNAQKSASNDQLTLSSRVEFTPVTGCNYRIASILNTTGMTYNIYSAKIIVAQQDDHYNGTLTGSLASASTVDYTLDTTSTPNLFSTAETAPRMVATSGDGTKMYFMSDTSNIIYQTSLSTAWDMSTASYSSESYSISHDGMNGLFFKPDGTMFFLMEDGTNQTVHSHTMTTPWDITTVSGGSDASSNLTMESGESASKGVWFNPDGTKMYVAGATNSDVYYYTLSTAWDITSNTYVGYYNFSSQTTSAAGLAFSPNGKKMFISGTGDEVYQYSLSTAWTVTSGVTFDNVTFAMGDHGVTETDIKGISFSGDMSWIYVVGSGEDIWCQFPSGISYSDSMMTKIEPQYLLQNTYKNSTGLQYYDTLWSLTDWLGVTPTFVHEINSSVDSSDSAKLQYDPTGTPTDITSSTATGANRARSSSMTMPTSDQTIDTNILNVPLYASRIIVSFTVPSLPVLTTPTATSVSIPSATLGATITSDGGLTLTARGTVWGFTPSPTTNSSAEGGTSTGAFSHTRTGLPRGAKIYYRGYATNSKGTAYSEDGIITASSIEQIQYDLDHSTILDVGDSASGTTVHLNFLVTSSNASDVITPKVEVRDVSTAFTGTATHTGDAFKFNPDVPRYRTYPAIIYDSANHRMIVFGGKDDTGTYLNDVWELKLPISESDVPIWRELSPSGTPPSARNAMVHVYDSTYQRLIIFGGYNGSSLGGFYSLTLPSDSDGAWSSFTPSGSLPGNRYTSDGIFDSLNQRLIIFGGYTTVDNNDAWKISLPSSLSSSASALLAPSGTKPSVRSEHSMVYDSANQRIVVFAGWGATRTNDVWQLTIPSNSDDGAWSQSSISGTAPAARSSHDTIYDPVNQRMLTFMGWNGTTYYNDIYELTLPSSGSFVWTNRTTADGTLPAKKRAMTGVYDSTNDGLIVFGGSDGGFISNEPLYVDLTQSGSLYWSEISPNVNLMAGDGSNSVYDSDNHQMIRWGGFSRIYDTSDPEGTGYHINEVWTYGFDSSNDGYNAWSNISPAFSPVAREVSSVVYDAYNKRFIMWGGLGYSQSEPLNDTWAMSMDRTSASYRIWVRLSPTGTPPSKRWGASAIYDPTNQRMIVFGGRLIGEATTHYYDVHILSLVSGSEAWSTPTEGGSGPTEGLFQTTAIYDATYTRMLILAGQKGTASFSDKLWELRWDNGTPNSMTWTDRTPTYTPTFAGRRGHIAGHDTQYDRMVVFGGWDGTNHYNDVWSFDISSLAVTATKITPQGTAPIVRRSLNGIFDPINQRLVLEGGRGSSSPINFLDDFWELSLQSSTSEWTWTELSPSKFIRATVEADSLTNNTAFHWRSWVTGSVSGDLTKSAFGDNSDVVTAATDFIVGVLSGNSGVKVWNGSSWTWKPLKVWNGSSWVAKPIKVWNSSSWDTKG